MMSLDESSLTTAEPYHIPGYCGYCPQFKYKIKETFGKTTHDLLTADGISRSSRPVLAPLGSCDERTVHGGDSVRLAELRAINLGDQKYGSQMVPGYTGYIPKGQHHFGDRYTIFSRNAISHMEEDRRQLNLQQQRLKDIISKQTGNGWDVDGGANRTARYKTPLKPIMLRTGMYFPRGIQHSLSPYVMDNDNPDKYMMSGYTGFVPRSRGLIGMGYPDVTNQALRDFTVEFQKVKRTATAPIVLLKPDVPVIDTKPIYHKDSGMVPHYTGHVPGEKFRYGRTFGHSTTNAIQ